MQKKAEQRDRGYNKKRRDTGSEGNHARHPSTGVPWCPKCQKEGRVASDQAM